MTDDSNKKTEDAAKTLGGQAKALQKRLLQLDKRRAAGEDVDDEVQAVNDRLREMEHEREELQAQLIKRRLDRRRSARHPSR